MFLSAASDCVIIISALFRHSASHHLFITQKTLFHIHFLSVCVLVHFYPLICILTSMSVSISQYEYGPWSKIIYIWTFLIYILWHSQVNSWCNVICELCNSCFISVQSDKYVCVSETINSLMIWLMSVELISEDRWYWLLRAFKNPQLEAPI